MILFLISFLMVFLSSYFITSIITDKKSLEGFIYILLTAFANVVLTIEILSLLNAISHVGVLILNVIFLSGSIFIWNKKNRPLWIPNVKDFFHKFWKAIRKDKYIFILSIGFLILISSALFLASFMPVINADAGAYHVLRSLFWISNHNLNHFEIPDTRNLILPINSEIVYAWILMFIKRSAWVGFVSFAGYLTAVFSLYGILSLMRLSMRRKLWTIFILSSFSSVICQVAGTETDIIIAGLILASMYLFWKGNNENKLVPVFMSALSYALAVGTKSTAFLAIPGTALFMIVISVYCNKKYFYKPLYKFLEFALINFIIFSSYNYVLNFINYGNPIGSEYFMTVHENIYGLRAIPANFIKYMFMFFDFSGFKWGQYYGTDIQGIRDSLLYLLGFSTIRDGLYTRPDVINQTLVEPLMGLGVLGLIVFVPCLLWALIKPVFCRKRIPLFLFLFTVIFIINICTMSYQLAFMIFSIRFLMSFCVISAPVLAYSYSKKFNLYKFIVFIFAMFYLTLVSTHLWARPFSRIVKYIKLGYPITQIREIGVCAAYINQIDYLNRNDYKHFYINEPCLLKRFIEQKIDNKYKILLFANMGDDLILIKLLENKGYDIDLGLYENIENINIDKYNIIVFIDNEQRSSYIQQFEQRKKETYLGPKGEIKLRKHLDNPCYYLDNTNKYITDSDDDDVYPYLSRCMIKDEYINKRFNLKLIDTLNIDSKPLDKKVKQPKKQYFFYENLNNPLK